MCDRSVHIGKSELAELLYLCFFNSEAALQSGYFKADMGTVTGSITGILKNRNWGDRSALDRLTQPLDCGGCGVRWASDASMNRAYQMPRGWLYKRLHPKLRAR